MISRDIIEAQCHNGIIMINRNIKLVQVPDDRYKNEMVRVLEQCVGIESAQLHGNIITLTYDRLKTGYLDIITLLNQRGYQTTTGMIDEFKTQYYDFTDNNYRTSSYSGFGYDSALQNIYINFSTGNNLDSRTSTPRL